MNQLGFKGYGQFPTWQSHHISDNIYFNILEDKGFDVDEHMIVNDYIKQLVALDSLTITNSHYAKSNGFKKTQEGVCVQWK